MEPQYIFGLIMAGWALVVYFLTDDLERSLPGYRGRRGNDQGPGSYNNFPSEVE